jgi:hypothetical protein
MMNLESRRQFLKRASTVALMSGAVGAPGAASPARREKAQIAITLDLEMSRNFPEWENTEWDYQKGNLDDAAKQYTVDVCRRVKAKGGVVHSFVVGQVFEQANIDWLKEIVQDGHALGNHTYDHVNVTARTPERVQYRFKRAPWLMEGRAPSEVISRNVRFCTEAMRERLGIEPNGFRTPGGFRGGLAKFPDVQKMLLGQGFKWASCAYAGNFMTPSGERPNQKVFDSVVQAQTASQPYRYPSGLIEIPMSPISDIGAFRTGRWPVKDFVKAIRGAVEWAIEHRAVFDFLCHPSCIGVVDPGFETVDMICDVVAAAGDRAEIVDLGRIAATA